MNIKSYFRKKHDHDPKFPDRQVGANSIDPDQEQSNQDLHCLPFGLHLLDVLLACFFCDLFCDIMALFISFHFQIVHSSIRKESASPPELDQDFVNFIVWCTRLIICWIPLYLNTKRFHTSIYNVKKKRKKKDRLV